MTKHLTDLTEDNMEETKPEKNFVKGVFIKMPHDKAPNFILLDMSFKPHEFFTWCQDHIDSKGWVNIQVKKSQKGTLYAELNSWKKKEEIPVEEPTPEPVVDTQPDLSDIPF